MNATNHLKHVSAGHTIYNMYYEKALTLATKYKQKIQNHLTKYIYQIWDVYAIL